MAKNEEKAEKPKAEAKESKPEKPKEKPKPDPTVAKIKTHTDGDFRLSKPMLKDIGFGAHAELKVKILELHKGKSVLLEIVKVNFNKAT